MLGSCGGRQPPLAPPSLSQIYVCIILLPPPRLSPQQPPATRPLARREGGVGGASSQAVGSREGMGVAGEEERGGGRQELDRIGVRWQDGREEEGKRVRRGEGAQAGVCIGGVCDTCSIWPHTQGQLRLSCAFSGQCQGQGGTLLGALSAGIITKPRSRTSPPPPPHPPGLGPGPLRPSARGGCLCEAPGSGGQGGAGCWAHGSQEQTIPPHGPLLPKSRPAFQPLRGRRRGPAIPREINATLM